jgi:hypothetical protein
MKRLLYWLLFLVGFDILLGGIILPFLIQLGFHLFAGWITFLMRTLPEVRPNWSALAFFLLCLSGFTVGVHLFLCWLTTHWGAGGPADAVPRRWPARWTGMLLAGFALTFLTAMAGTGVAHQVGWLIAGKDKWFGSQYALRLQLLQTGANVQHLAGQQKWSLSRTRKEYWSNLAQNGGPASVGRIRDDLHVVFVEGKPDELQGIVLLYRAGHSETRIVVVDRQGTEFKLRTKFEEELTRLKEARPSTK